MVISRRIISLPSRSDDWRSALRAPALAGAQIISTYGTEARPMPFRAGPDEPDCNEDRECAQTREENKSHLRRAIRRARSRDKKADARHECGARTEREEEPAHHAFSHTTAWIGIPHSGQFFACAKIVAAGDAKSFAIPCCIEQSRDLTAFDPDARSVAEERGPIFVFSRRSVVGMPNGRHVLRIRLQFEICNCQFAIRNASHRSDSA